MMVYEHWSVSSCSGCSESATNSQHWQCGSRTFPAVPLRTAAVEARARSFSILGCVASLTTRVTSLECAQHHGPCHERWDA